MTARPSSRGWGAPVLLGLFGIMLIGAPARAQPGDGSPAAGAAASKRAIARESEEAAQPAAPAECVGDRFIFLVESGFAPELGAEVRTDFAAELAHRGLSICDAASTTRLPSAVVEVQANDTVVVIELDDRVTHKRVARDLSLQGIPANGRALAIAIAIDELLRASWAELTLRRARDAEEEEEDDDYTVEQTRPVNARGRVRTPLRYHVGADLGYLHTARNFDAFALDLRGSVRAWGWGWFELSLGGLGSVPAHSARGDVVAVGFRSALTAGACSPTRSRMFGCGGVRAEVQALRLRGSHAEMAQARSQTAGVLQSSLVGLLAVTLQQRSYLFGELGLGAVLQGAEATSGASTVMGITGLLVSLSIGVGYEL